ncbi:MAG: DUF3822 family protein [Salinivirgaceae bacterium]|jgi:hypothetical protein|nr:DUF3822 family protein [Salinivirgaceae bacterium]
MNYIVSTIDKIDERFDFDQIHNYIKSIQISLNGFSYIVTDPAEPAHLALRSYDFGTEISVKRIDGLIADLFQNEDVLSQPSQKTIVTYMERAYAMAPQMLFLPDSAHKLIDVNFKKDEFAHVTHASIPASDIVFASRMPENIYKTLSLYSENLQVVPYQCALAVNAIQTLQHHGFSEGFFMNVNYQFFDLMYIKDQKIVFYNNFGYAQYADVLYFTLATLEKLSIDPNKIHLFIQGHELVKEVILQELNMHVRNVYLDRRILGTAYSHQFEQLPLYQYKLLTGLYSCV